MIQILKWSVVLVRHFSTPACPCDALSQIDQMHSISSDSDRGQQRRNTRQSERTRRWKSATSIVHIELFSEAFIFITSHVLVFIQKKTKRVEISICSAKRNPLITTVISIVLTIEQERRGRSDANRCSRFARESGVGDIEISLSNAASIRSSGGGILICKRTSDNSL